MDIVFLGTGTSQGVPMVAQVAEGCCDLADKRNWRTRTSAHVRMGNLAIQIDAAPEFRLQCLEHDIRWIDYFFLTHGHADHVLGMDDLRRFIDLRGGEALPVYSTAEGLTRVQSIYPYAIRPKPEFVGYPAFNLKLMPSELELSEGKVWMSLLPHGRVNVMGLVFEEKVTGKRLAYFTDCKRVTAEAAARAEGADVIVLDALRPEEHPTHMNIEEAVATAEILKGKRTYFTHMTYRIDHERDSRDLPPGVFFAYDGLRVEV